MVDKATADKWAHEDIERRPRIPSRLGECRAQGRAPRDSRTLAAALPPLKGATRPVTIPGPIRSIETAENLLGPVTEAWKAQARAQELQDELDAESLRIKRVERERDLAIKDRDNAEQEANAVEEELVDARRHICRLQEIARGFRDLIPPYAGSD